MLFHWRAQRIHCIPRQSCLWFYAVRLLGWATPSGDLNMVETAFKQPQNANKYFQNIQPNCTTPTCKECGSTESRHVWTSLFGHREGKSFSNNNNNKNKEDISASVPCHCCHGLTEPPLCCANTCWKPTEGTFATALYTGKKAAFMLLIFWVEIIVCWFSLV